VHVSSLSLRDFRSYDVVDLQWEPGVSVLVGPNGQGKTNIVEALHYLATLDSHRVATDAPLVRSGAARAQVQARLHSGDRSLTLDVEINPAGANRARVNRSPVRATREVVGLLRVVLFAPEDLAIVKGDPGERRRFLDRLLVTRRPRLAGVRADYERVLKQRTALLKSAAALRRQRGSGAVDLSTLQVWDGHLARTGGELVACRVGLLEELGGRMASVYAELAPAGATARASYASSVSGFGVGSEAARAAGADAASWAELLTEALVGARSGELERGQCLVGPHRDDVVLSLGDLPARGYASQGESWSMALALRLASFDLLSAESDSPPVLLLDDVFAELDARRRDHLAERVSEADQVIVTAAVADDVPARLAGVRFDVASGGVERVG
jgi:DNA replication and repair protein RecF